MPIVSSSSYYLYHCSLRLFYIPSARFASGTASLWWTQWFSTEYFPGRRQWWLCSRTIVCSPDSDTSRLEWCTLVCVYSPSFSRYTDLYRKWHVKQLKVVRKRSRARWTTAKTYTRNQIYGFVFILFVLMFSKNFYTESMVSYFTFFLIEKFGVSIQTSQLCLFVFLAAEVSERSLAAG